MMMQPNHHHQPPPWKLSIHTKAKNFHLKLKANNPFSSFPSSNLFIKFSLRFKFHHFQINVRSEPHHHSFTQKLKSKSLKLLSKLRFRRGSDSANKTAHAAKSFRIIRGLTRSKGTVGAEVRRNFALWCRSISEKDVYGMFKHGLMMLLCLVSYVYVCLTRKRCTMMLFLVVAILVTPMVQWRKYFLISNYSFKDKIMLHLLEFLDQCSRFYVKQTL